MSFLNATAVVALISLSLILVVQASPGAHGPNGEHINVKSKTPLGHHPRFESFTESFELVGELINDQLTVYLHDFKTNKPVSNALIELSLDSQAVTLTYSDTLVAYTTKNKALIAALQQPNLHEIIITIISKEYDDLLVASFNNVQNFSSEQVEKVNLSTQYEWHILPIFLVIFLLGWVLGRKHKGSK